MWDVKKNSKRATNSKSPQNLRPDTVGKTHSGGGCGIGTLYTWQQIFNSIVNCCTSNKYF